jgi:phosphatidylinositol alpha-mannosyltransferase
VSCQVHRLANGLVSLGERVTCFSFSEKPVDAAYDHVMLKYATSSPALQRFETALRFRKVNTSGYDVIHYHGDDYLCKGSTRRVRTFYGSALYEALFAARFLRFFRQALFYSFEWVSCLRKGAKAGISQTTTRALPLVTICIPCGVPLDRFSPEGVKTAYPSVLFVGDCESRKRGALLLSAFCSQVAIALPDAELTVVGPQPCEGRGVRYVGQIGEDALIEEYRKAWVYCCASSYEGFGVPICEAMACGTAVVACDNAGVRELLRQNYNGLLCKPETLAKALLALLTDEGRRLRLAENGLSFVKRFDMPVVVKKYHDLYRTICVPQGKGT